MQDAAPGIGYVVLVFLMMPLLRGILYYRDVRKHAQSFEAHRNQAVARAIPPGPSAAPEKIAVGGDADLIGTPGF